MIPPFVIPKRSPSFISKSEQGTTRRHLLHACNLTNPYQPGCSCTSPAACWPFAPMSKLILILLSMDKHPSPGSTTLLPAASLQLPSFLPESYGAAPEAGLRAEIIANAELCLVRNMIFTYKIQRSRGIHSSRLQHTSRSSTWKKRSSWHIDFPVLLNYTEQIGLHIC